MTKEDLNKELLSLGFTHIDYKENKGGYDLKAWFKWKAKKGMIVYDDKLELTADKNEPEEILLQAKIGLKSLSYNDNIILI